MKRFRFSIASLLVLVLFCAVAFAAMKAANELWDSAVFSLALALLSASVVLAIYRTERRRAFWLGFAIFGGIYLGSSLIPPITGRLITTKGLAYLDSKVVRTPAFTQGSITATYASTNWIFTGQPSPPPVVSGNVVTTTPIPTDPTWIELVQPATNPVTSTGTVSLSPNILVTSPAVPAATASGTTEHFLSTGHSLIALAFGFLGGGFTRLLWRGPHQRAAAGPDRDQAANPDPTGTDGPRE